jgi:hypothetical protein
MKQIFIGGTGRSGTTILLHALYRHPELYAIPFESKFLVGANGMSDLVDSLTRNYSISKACDAVERFDHLLRYFLTDRERASGSEFHMLDIFGEQPYYRALNQFIDRITRVAFREEFPPARMADKLYPSEPAAAMRYLGRYFADRNELLAICRELVDALFTQKALEMGKQGWVEKTPANLTRLAFLQELYPDSVFIHIKRDPRGVVYSQRRQRWAPDGIREAALYMVDTYEWWLDTREHLGLAERKYIEVSLEELVAAPAATLDRIASYAALSPYSAQLVNDVVRAMESYWKCALDDPRIDSKLNPWKVELSSDELAQLNAILGEYIVAMGFQV